VDGATAGLVLELVAMALWALGFGCITGGLRLWLTIQA